MSKKSQSYGFSSLSLDASHPSALKPLIGKANDGQVLRDHAQQFHCEPQRLPWRPVPELLPFPSMLQPELRRGACAVGSTPARLWGQCARGAWPSSQNKQSAHVTPGAAQRGSCLEVFSWNAGCLATGSCFSPNSNTWGWGSVWSLVIPRLFCIIPHSGSQKIQVLQSPLQCGYFSCVLSVHILGFLLVSYLCF